MQRDWESYLDGSMTEKEKLEIGLELEKSAKAREELAKAREIDHLMETSQEAFRLSCPSVEDLGSVVSGQKEATEIELDHFGRCQSCQHELKEVAKFQHALMEKKQIVLSRFAEKGQWLIESLKRGMAQILDPTFLEPALSLQPITTQPAFAHEPTPTELPGLWIDDSVQGIFLSIDKGCLMLGGPNCQEQMLTAKITKEDGETVHDFQAKIALRIPLDGVWHIEVRQLSKPSINVKREG